MKKVTFAPEDITYDNLVPHFRRAHGKVAIFGNQRWFQIMNEICGRFFIDSGEAHRSAIERSLAFQWVGVPDRATGVEINYEEKRKRRLPRDLPR